MYDLSDGSPLVINHDFTVRTARQQVHEHNQTDETNFAGMTASYRECSESLSCTRIQEHMITQRLNASSRCCNLQIRFGLPVRMSFDHESTSESVPEVLVMLSLPLERRNICNHFTSSINWLLTARYVEF